MSSKFQFFNVADGACFLSNVGGTLIIAFAFLVQRANIHARESIQFLHGLGLFEDSESASLVIGFVTIKIIFSQSDILQRSL